MGVFDGALDGVTGLTQRQAQGLAEGGAVTVRE